MIAANKCRVDDCDRNAAVSIVRDHLPGPLPLCATHTEDFRMNSEGWNIVWDQTSPEPTSVKVGVPATVGRSGAPAPDEMAKAPDGTVQRVKSRLSLRRRPPN
jgi:hypothetical protein